MIMPKYLNIFICCVIIALLAWFLVLPKYQTLKSLQLSVERKQSELHYGEEYLADLQTLSNELDQEQENLSKIDSALPAESSFPSLFSFLQKSVSENGLVLDAINFNFPSSTSGSKTTGSEVAGSGTQETSEELSSETLSSEIKEIHFSLSVSGSYSAFKNFLYCLEKSARFWEPVSFSFSSSSSSSQSQGSEIEETQTKKSDFSFKLTIKTHTY